MMIRLSLLAAALMLAGTAVAGDLSSAEKIRKIDTNGDGELTAAEHAAGAQKMFAEMDADKNGRVTAAEMDAGHAKMMRGDGKPMATDDWNEGKGAKRSSPAPVPERPATAPTNPPQDVDG